MTAHIVVGALEDGEGTFIGWTAVTAPMGYDQAIKRYDELQGRIGRIGHTLPGRSGRVMNYAVRSVDDPRFATLVGRGYADAVRRDGLKGDESGEIKAARAWAKQHGWEGRPGGWIYNPRGKPVVQGWWSFAEMLKRKSWISEGADDKWYVFNREVVS
jgi:hypothetical protein